MGSSLVAQDDGSTPIDPEELDDLIPAHLETKAELNQWEALNISQAQEWIYDQKNPVVLSVEWIVELHRRMFDQTWKWAGQFRRSDKNISPFSWTEVPQQLRELVANTTHQFQRSDREADHLDDMAARFHHRLVLIHPWPNGNGRHARLATDALLASWARPIFSWGSGADLIAKGESRDQYLNALRAADGGSFSSLKTFLRG